MNDQILASSEVVSKDTEDPFSHCVDHIFSWSFKGLEQLQMPYQTILLPEKKKKKERERGREERRIFFAFLIWGRTILQKISGDFPSIPMVRTGAHALPWVIKRDMLQGSHTFSLFSGRRDSPAKKGMVNPHGKAGNIVCPYPLSLCPHPPLLQVVTGHLMPKEVTRPGVNQVGTRRS